MTTHASDGAIKAINHLIEINEKGKDGYELAAKNVDKPEYKSAFQEYARQRHDFTEKLRGHVAGMGGKEADSPLTEASAAIHRGWINIKSVVTGGDSEAVLDECARGDEAAVEAYEEALRDNTFPAEVETVLRQQHGAIAEAHRRVKTLAEVED